MMINQSEFSFMLEHATFTELFIGPYLSFVLFFSFSLFIGSFTGEMISQIVLTFIFAGFPYGFYLLIFAAVDLHFRMVLNPSEWVLHLTLYFYTFSHMLPGYDMIIPIIGIGLFTIFGALLYKRNKIEHNGEFLLFKKLHPIFLIGMTICFSMFGGILISSIAPWNAHAIQITAYWGGFLLFAFFSYTLAKKLLKMNLTVKNK